MKQNKPPSPELYALAKKKLGDNKAIIDWFFKPVAEGAACPQSLLNINADFAVKEMLEKLPDKETE